MRRPRSVVTSMFVSVVCMGAAPPLAAMARQVPRGVVDAVEPYTADAVARAIGDRGIVLLGENGHGVAEFSATKVDLVRHLHRHLGFDVVAFESGFHECREANDRLARQPVSQSFLDCLIYVLEHAELEPLFEYARSTRGTDRPLAIAGIDLQLQGRATRTRPPFLRAALAAVAPGLGDTVAILDSILVEKALESTDSLRRWVRDHGRALRALYDSAAGFTGGDTAWTFRTASALMRRELHRVAALAFGLQPPTDVYASRDEWMAWTIAHLAGEGDARRKVVVWLHNDHARYGEWRAGPLRVRAAGQWLQERFPGEVFSLGFLMGGGSFGDNFRRAQTVPEPPPEGLERTLREAGHPVAFLRLTPPASAAVRDWAGAEHPYLRGGDVQRMRPGREFDALLFFHRVSVATYGSR